MKQLIQLYTEYKGSEPVRVEQLPGAASNRRYVRLADAEGGTLMGVVGESPRENHAFIALSRHMTAQGLAVPRILAVSADEMRYLQQDLGHTALYDLIAAADASVPDLLRQVMQDLPRLQFLTDRGFDFDRDAFREPAFSVMTIRWDLNYCKYCFLKLCGVPLDEIRLQNFFDSLEAALLEPGDPWAFLYRDFQSRNVMMADGRPHYIDFQGGYRGPVYYDVASFLWQTRAGYTPQQRAELAETYRQALSAFAEVPADVFRQRLRLFVVFRLLQTLGTYGFRGLYEHKTLFLTPIRQTLNELMCLCRGPLSGQLAEVGYLGELIASIASTPRFNPTDDERLTVRITSFSYKRGIPEDLTGNGGGFVFDCRAPHNPGRYAEYKQLTGLDQPVIDFLEGNPEMPAFMQHVYGLVDPAVETYLRRGFSSLMVNFGCTGGQHRSVYAAQHLADHLHALHPDLHIILIHREQNIYHEYV